MTEFFDDYFNIKKIIRSKREYKKQMARVKIVARRLSIRLW